MGVLSSPLPEPRDADSLWPARAASPPAPPGTNRPFGAGLDH